MSSYVFTRTSSHRIGETAIQGPPGLAYTLAAVVKVASLPGAGVRHCAVSQTNTGVPARRAALFLSGSNSGSLAAYNGSSAELVPSTLIVPPLNVWLLLGVTKPAGTAKLSFFMYEYENGTWTEFNTTSTFGNRTAAAVAYDIGSISSGDYWNGHVAAALALNYNLSVGQWRRLLDGRDYWRALTMKAWPYGQAAGVTATIFADLTRPRPATGSPSPSMQNFLAYGTGTLPALDSSTPPGW